MRIGVVNAWGANRGDEAMLSALVHFLNACLPQARTVVHSNAWLDLLRHRNVEVRPWLTLTELFPGSGRVARRLRALAAIATPTSARAAAARSIDYDFVVSSPAGPYLGDLYPQTEIQCLLQLALPVARGVPFGILATSAGPFRAPLRNILRSRVLRHAAFWTVREAMSAGHLTSLALPIEPVVGTDLVFAHPNRPPAAFASEARQEALANTVAKMDQQPTVLVTLNLTDYLREDGHVERFDLDSYVAQISALLEHVLKRTECAILLMPHFYMNFQEQVLLQRVHNRLKRPDRVTSLDPTFDAECQMYLYTHAVFAISHRYHPTIFAARAGCPFLCIRHQFKADGMLAFFGDPGPRVATPDGVARWIEGFDEAWASRDVISAQVHSRLPAAEAAAQTHLDILGSHLRQLRTAPRANGNSGQSSAPH